MNRNLITLFVLLFLLVSCASPTLKPPVGDESFSIPVDSFSTPEIYLFPTITPTAAVVGVNFLTEFSDKEEDWQIVPGAVTAAQINAEVARQEGSEIKKDFQKVITGFLRSTVTQEGGQVLEVLYPAELANKKLAKLKVKYVKQVPVLSSHAVLLEDYFTINFPDVVKKWKAQGATDADFKYAAVITITWATKYGPLRVSHMITGKYFSEAQKYPGQLDFLRLCMYEQTQEHLLSNKKLGLNWFSAPIVGLSGTAKGDIKGEMKSDAFGWTPMADFAKAQSKTLNAIGSAVDGVVIESGETLAYLQAMFDRAFMPVHCAEAVLK